MLETLWYELAGRSGGWLVALAGVAWKSALILAATALVGVALRGKSAALRHQVWLVGVGSALAVPLLALALPRIAVPAPRWAAEWLWERGWTAEAEYAVPELAHWEAPDPADAPQPADVAHELPGALAPAVAAGIAEGLASAGVHAGGWSGGRAGSRASGGIAIAAAPRALPVPAQLPPVGWEPAPMPDGGPYGAWSYEGGGGFPWALVGLSLWLFGAWLVAAGLVVGALRVAWLDWQSQPFGTGRVTVLARDIAAELGVGSVRVLRGAATAMPMTWGLVRPTVLLPDGAEDWPVDQLDAVLRHELAHARRRDTLTQLVADVACALYWFNPLAWLAAYRLRIEREHACDDEVLASGSKPSDYATQLLDMTRALRTARVTALAAIPMARPSQLRERLEAVLDEDRRRGGVSRAAAARSWLAAAFMVLPLAMLGFGPSVSWAEDADPDFDFEVPAAAELEADLAAALEEAAALEAELAGLIHVTPMPDAIAVSVGEWQECGRSGRGRRGTSFNNDGDRQRIEIHRDGCRYVAEIEGEIGFDDAFRRIVSVSRGGLVVIEAEEASGERSVEIRNDGGALVHTYREGNRDRPFDAAAQAWLDGVLLELLRAGFMAEQRAAALLRHGGVPALVQEIGALRSDYVRRIYYQAAIASGDTGAAATAQLVRRAGGEIDSDYELAELLISTARDGSFDDAVRAAFIEAAGSLDSDYEKRRALSVVLARTDLSAANVAAMLDHATTIDSDYELAELLLALTRRYVNAPPLRSAYLGAAATIESDYEKRRVLDQLLRTGSLDAPGAAQVLDVASTLGSDYERAELLVGVARADLADAGLQHAYIETAVGMGSDYEKRRAYDALLAGRKLGADPLAALLDAVAGIDSDHEKAEVLLHVTRTQTLAGANRDAFARALETIGSRHDHGRVASALVRSGR